MRVKKLLAMFLLVLLLCQPMLALQSLASAESSRLFRRAEYCAGTYRTQEHRLKHLPAG